MARRPKVKDMPRDPNDVVHLFRHHSTGNLGYSRSIEKGSPIYAWHSSWNRWRIAGRVGERVKRQYPWHYARAVWSYARPGPRPLAPHELTQTALFLAWEAA